MYYYLHREYFNLLIQTCKTIDASETVTEVSTHTLTL
jgi:hypothetical protein